MVHWRLSRLLQAEKSLLQPSEVLSVASVLFLVRRGQRGIRCVCRPWLFATTHDRVCQGSEITLFLDTDIKFKFAFHDTWLLLMLSYYKTSFTFLR